MRNIANEIGCRMSYWFSLKYFKIISNNMNSITSSFRSCKYVFVHFQTHSIRADWHVASCLKTVMAFSKFVNFEMGRNWIWKSKKRQKSPKFAVASVKIKQLLNSALFSSVKKRDRGFVLPTSLSLIAKQHINFVIVSYIAFIFFEMYKNCGSPII